MIDYKNEIKLNAYKQMYSLLASALETAILQMEAGNTPDAVRTLARAQGQAEDIYIYASELAKMSDDTEETVG